MGDPKLMGGVHVCEMSLAQVPVLDWYHYFFSSGNCLYYPYDAAVIKIIFYGIIVAHLFINVLPVMTL